MLSSENPLEPLRYERKFKITEYAYSEVEQFVKFHPACFSEIFQERNINNIYFDTLGMNNYHDNIDGQQLRTKTRIRWYGDLFGKINSPVLEYKIKKGLVGYKNSFALNAFMLDDQFDKQKFAASLQVNDLPDQLRHSLLSLTPTLLNRYKRKYFLSGDKKFRVTLDHELTYYGITYQKNTFLNKSRDFNSVVLELKYDSVFEEEAKAIVSGFPFPITKNSKYIQGVERIII